MRPARDSLGCTSLLDLSVDKTLHKGIIEYSLQLRNAREPVVLVFLLFSLFLCFSPSYQACNCSVLFSTNSLSVFECRIFFLGKLRNLLA